MRVLSATVRERLRSALESRKIGLDALPFVEAVVIQRAWPLGEAPALPASNPELAESSEARVAEQVIRLIDESGGDGPDIARAAGELAEDLALLAAFFQNLDLLPADRGRPIDAIAIVTAAALQRLADTLSGS